ncbi:MAG: antibiotic biosynthesis monooxygenase [Pseudomonadota bacterium]
MVVAMNRCRIHPGRETAFDAIWQGRKSHLDSVPGFVGFHLLRGPAQDNHVLYCSHSVWPNRAAFDAVPGA